MGSELEMERPFMLGNLKTEPSHHKILVVDEWRN